MYIIASEFLWSVIAAGGGAAVVAFLLFRFLGEKWIEEKFNSRLEILRHEQARDLAEFRSKVDTILNGAIRYQELEFEILPEAWRLLHLANIEISSILSPLQTSYDLDSLTDKELREVLKDTNFTQSQREKIKNSLSKNELYHDLSNRYAMTSAKRTFSKFNQYVNEKSIFMPKNIREQFDKAANVLWSAIIDKEVGIEVKDRKMQNDGWRQLKNEFQPIYSSIKIEIQNYLANHSKNNT